MAKDRNAHIEKHGRYYRFVLWQGNRRIRKSLHTANLSEAIARRDILLAQYEGRAPKSYAFEKHMAKFADGLEILEMIDYTTPTQRAVVAKQTPLTDARWPKGLSHSYQTRCKRALRLLEAFLRKEKLAETFEAVAPQVALDFTAWREDEGDRPSSVAVIISALRTLWAHLGDRRHDWSNPWKAVKVRNAKERQDGRPFTLEEAKIVLSAFPEGTPVGDACRVSVLTGMRLGEIMRLTPADIIDDVIVIRKAKTAAGVRRVPVNDELAPILDRLGKGKSKSVTYFSPRANVSDKFGRKLRKLGLEDTREGNRRSRTNFHSWRNTAIKQLLDKGIPEVISAYLVGHKVKTLTYGLYAKGVSDNQLRAATAMLRVPT